MRICMRCCCCYSVRTSVLASLLSAAPSPFPSPACSQPQPQPQPPPRSQVKPILTSEFAVQYLVDSCGLPSDRALRASRYISHLKSPAKPDAVLQFLTQSGVTQAHITAAALRDASFLGCAVDKCFKPRMTQLSQLGFSPPQISLLFSLCPTAFKLTEFPRKIQFWLPILGSVEKLLCTLKKNFFLLTVNLQTVAIPNLSFLQDHCGLSLPQIVRLIKSAPRVITSSPAALKIKAQRAEELGFKRSSPMFVYGLFTVCCLNQPAIDARLKNLQSLGLSKHEVRTIVSRLPSVLRLREEVIGRKIEFLTAEVGCDKLQLVSNPCLLSLSLEKWLIPRSRVRKLFQLKGLLVANLKFVSFMQPSQKVFMEKFVMPYVDAIPGLHQAYMDACAGNIEGLQWFDRSLHV